MANIWHMAKSILGRHWQLRNINEELVREVTNTLQISDFLARLVALRVRSVGEAYDFLNPRLKNLLPDPFHLLDMDKAVSRVIKAIYNQEKIYVFADYDVDGASSAALIKNIFHQLGNEVDIYVPDRIEEGYGPTVSAMNKISKKASLLITVDCGSVAFEALDYAAGLGLEVIVIDHHLSIDELPKAVAIINPNRLDEVSKCKNLAAAGVTFLFIIALCSTLKKMGFFTARNLSHPDLLEQLDIVALGTVCDVMSLTGINRALVAQGLKIAQGRRNSGYKALCNIAAIDDKINCYHLGFILGPRINAGGRVGKPFLGAALLSSKLEEEANLIARELEYYNNERKTIESLLLEQAYIQGSLQQNDALIFIVGNNWHPGVIGIIASRVKEKYNKPVAVIAVINKEGKGSCRSICGIDFSSKIAAAKVKGLITKGGGHAAAAGFTVQEEQINPLRDFLKEEFAKEINSLVDYNQEFYDAILTPRAINQELLTEIDRLAPFGNGNQPPVFRFTNLSVSRVEAVGTNHLKVIFTCNNYSKRVVNASIINAVGFNLADTGIRKALMVTKAEFSVIGTLKLNKWQDREIIQLHILDLIAENNPD